jgi:cytidyltransferase-like protein
MRYGVILMRAQPVHRGHIDMIEKALEENDRILVVLGSANKQGTKRNPFPVELREKMLYDALNDYDLVGKVEVLKLSDWSMENAYQYAKEWGAFFYYNVVNKIQEKTFTMYYNDDIQTVLNWFAPEITERVSVKRTEKTIDVSATKIREAIKKLDVDYLSSVLSPSTYRMLPTLRELLGKADKDDYIMD